MKMHINFFIFKLKYSTRCDIYRRSELYLHEISSISLYSIFYILQFLRIITFPTRYIFIYFHVEDIFSDLPILLLDLIAVRKSLRIRRVLKVFYIIDYMDHPWMDLEVD